MKELILRYAAGEYWLIKPIQNTGYIPPLMINESAADIIRSLQAGKNVHDTAVLLSEGDNTIIEEIEQDIEELKKQIRRHFYP